MKQLLENPNILQAEGNITPYNGGQPASVRCPHCRHLGTFGAIGGGIQYVKTVAGPKPAICLAVVSMRICPNARCRGLVFTAEVGGEFEIILPREPVAISLDGLPNVCVRTLVEAADCHSAGAYRASAMMIRRLLEEICELNNSPGKNLHERIESLKSRIVLPQSLFDAMGEMKALGNDAAHVEAKNYNSIGKEESEDSIELACEILKSLYQLDGLVARLQARKHKIAN